MKKNLITILGVLLGVVVVLILIARSSFFVSLSGPATSTPAYKSATTTYFWVGEPSDASNAFIPNDMSYWDEKWQKHFGGADNPDKARCGYAPCAFAPKENPFYVALPYAELDTKGNLKASAIQIPWYSPGKSPLLKNHWVEVVHGTSTCYGQWEDVGPNNEDDFSYVFGSSSTPTNTFGAHAGLDISPALWKCLGMLDNDTTRWRFVEESDVPDGPWKATVTVSDTTWGN
jgi:hypothetical protein